MRRYNPKEIEPKWQKIWDETQVYKADLKSSKPKYIGMSMLNYPSGAGIHIGHAMNYTISDVKARFKRQQGYESYHPVGWDSFGLPAENYAIKTGVSPQESMAKIIPMYHKQYKAMGWSNDWGKEIATHQPEYYKWTQWIFTQLHKNGLAYQDTRMQWWCPVDKTVLANEQVIDGKCWRHDGPNDPPAEKKEIKQWFFKITDYADELLEATDELDWSEGVKLAQKNWIGKSQGAEIDFKLDNIDLSIKVFTTRPDTIFGATFLVLAPEHKILNKLSISSEVKDYIKQAEAKTELERQESKVKTGVRLDGINAINPANGEKIPVFVADYVLLSYGTGAIMAVPAHDELDYEFAKKFHIPIRQVVMEVFSDKLTPMRPGVETKSRKAVQCIIKHTAQDKYLLLKKLQWQTETFSLVNGGIDGNESPEEAVRREVLEESGLINISSIKQVGQPYIAEFYHEMKKENVRAEMYTFEVVLENLERVEVSDEETGINKQMWVKSNELIEKVHGEGARRILKEFFSNFSTLAYEGVIINSGKYDGMDSAVVREKITAKLGKEKVNYKMRDWSVSRQRYWGAPIPMIHCRKCGAVPVPDQDLPVLLPELDNYEPTGDGRSALARAKSWLEVDCPNCGGPAERETDTMDTYVDSSWYMYRYMDPHNDKQSFDPAIVKKWEPVDFYNGADHATAHLLYARFFGHFFKKIGLVGVAEPFKQFLFNGKITAADGQMFSKSKGNGVDPLEIIDQGYGADALRTYLMFAAPLDQWVRWDPNGVPGTYRFLNRVWNLIYEYLEAEADNQGNKVVLSFTHRAIKKVTNDLEQNKYNTAIAAMMKLTNELYIDKAKNGFKGTDDWKFALESLVQLMAPFAPHIAEELWRGLGNEHTVNKDSWPQWNDKLVQEEMITLAVQINGKVRSEIVVPVDISEAEAITAAKSDEKIATILDGKTVKKAIYVPGRLVSLVA